MKLNSRIFESLVLPLLLASSSVAQAEENASGIRAEVRYELGSIDLSLATRQREYFDSYVDRNSLREQANLLANLSDDNETVVEFPSEVLLNSFPIIMTQRVREVKPDKTEEFKYYDFVVPPISSDQSTHALVPSDIGVSSFSKMICPEQYLTKVVELFKSIDGFKVEWTGKVINSGWQNTVHAVELAIYKPGYNNDQPVLYLNVDLRTGDLLGMDGHPLTLDEILGTERFYKVGRTAERKVQLVQVCDSEISCLKEILEPVNTAYRGEVSRQAEIVQLEEIEDIRVNFLAGAIQNHINGFDPNSLSEGDFGFSLSHTCTGLSLKYNGQNFEVLDAEDILRLGFAYPDVAVAYFNDRLTYLKTLMIFPQVTAYSDKADFFRDKFIYDFEVQTALTQLQLSDGTILDVSLPQIKVTCLGYPVMSLVVGRDMQVHFEVDGRGLEDKRIKAYLADFEQRLFSDPNLFLDIFVYRLSEDERFLEAGDISVLTDLFTEDQLALFTYDLEGFKAWVNQNNIAVNNKVQIVLAERNNINSNYLRWLRSFVYQNPDLKIKMTNNYLAPDNTAANNKASQFPIFSVSLNDRNVNLVWSPELGYLIEGDGALSAQLNIENLGDSFTQIKLKDDSGQSRDFYLVYNDESITKILLQLASDDRELASRLETNESD